MKIKLSTEGIIKHNADCVVVGMPSDGVKLSADLAKLDQATDGVLAGYAKHRDLLKLHAGHVVPLAKGGYKALLLVAQPEEAHTSWTFQQSLAKATKTLAKLKAKTAVFHLPSLTGAPAASAWAVRQAAQAIAAGAYKFKLGMAPATQGPAQVTLLPAAGFPAAATARALRIGTAIGNGMRVAQHLGEQPPNLLYPDTLARTAAKLGRAAGLKAKILDRKELVRLKMGGLLAVGQGSPREPRLLVLHHAGGSKGAAPVVLVGKGITFDTGGNSIKPGAAMMDMKFDMCGAAGVIGTILACADMQLPLNVVAVVPSAENMVAGNSFRPDDIIRMMDGQKVEVLNTDAEGRLVLADALTYAQKFLKPAVLVDAATLTGACLVALGQHRTGMCATTDKLAAALAAAGEDSADPCWRLPLDDVYDKLLEAKSGSADFSNIGGGRNAGTITAACFLKRFVTVREWAHLDIAGTAWQRRRASGRPVPLLTSWLAGRAGWLKD